MNFTRNLPQQPFVAGGNTGAALQLRDLPEDMDGGAVYCRSMSFRVHGTVHATTAGTANFSRLLAQLLIRIPEVADLLNLTGNRLARLYRLRNFGNLPPGAAGNWATVTITAAGNVAVDLTFVHEFAASDARRLDDGAIPVRLLKAGTVKTTFGALADFSAVVDTTALLLDVSVDLCRKRELRLGPIACVDSVEFTAGSKQPTVDACEGKITHAGIIPTAEGLFLSATDYTVLGLGYGAFKFTEDSAPVDSFYDGFNRIAAVDFEKHTGMPSELTTSIPLVFAPGGTQGQHITFETVPANAKPRILTDKATNGYALVRRFVLARSGPAYKRACTIMGIHPTKPMPASKKPSASADVNDFVPAKV